MGKIIALLFLGFFTLFACQRKSEENMLRDKKIKISLENKEKYNVLLKYRNSEKDKIKGDFLYLFFETDFDNDFLEVFSDGIKKFSDTIKTDYSLGLAEDMELGKISEINELCIRINNGNDIIIRDIRCNLLKINYIKDSIVIVEFSNKFLPYY